MSDDEQKITVTHIDPPLLQVHPCFNGHRWACTWDGWQECVACGRRR